jgi:hypothetical protein
MKVDFGAIMQHGYIVADVEKAAAEWAKRLDVGPFYVAGGMPMEQYYYRGVRMTVELRMAFAYWHGIQIELIQQVNDADSLYQRAAHSSPGKLNHVATVVKDIDSLLASRGLANRVIQNGDMPSGLKFVYLEEYLPGGLHLELIQATPSTLMAFAGMEKAARLWDGRKPIRSMADLGADLAALPA